MSTKADTVKRGRTAIVLEYESQEDFDEALKHGVQCARERFINIKFGLKGRDEHGPTIEVRTTRARRKPK
jgi:hypothetical protein